MNRAATNPNSVPTANPLGTESVIKLTVRYAVPSVISLVVNSLYNMVDQIFIGQGVGYLGNAATNVIMPMTLILMAIAMMFGNGASSFMSLQLGKKEPAGGTRCRKYDNIDHWGGHFLPRSVRNLPRTTVLAVRCKR